MRRSLRTKILLLSLLPAAAMYLLVAVVAYFAAQSVAQGLVLDRDRELARLSAAEVSASLQEYPELLSGVARDLLVGGQTDADLARALADDAIRLTYFDGGVVLLDNLGRVIATLPEDPAVPGADWSSWPVFRQIIQNPNRPAFSNVEGEERAEALDDALSLAVAVPVLTARNELRGVLVGRFRIGPDVLNPFYGTLLRLRLESKGEAHIEMCIRDRCKTQQERRSLRPEERQQRRHPHGERLLLLRVEYHRHQHPRPSSCRRRGVRSASRLAGLHRPARQRL